MLTLFVPSSYEVAVFRRALTEMQKTRLGAAPGWTGKLENVPVRVVECGMGQPHSALRIEAVLRACAEEKEPVWLAGFGGGLDPALARYDMVYLAGDAAAEKPILAAQRKIPARKIDKIYTSDVVVDTEAKKIAAFQATGAPIVDMETGPFLELAKEHGRPAAVLRVISDDVAEEFPADLIGHSYDFAQGKDTPGRLAWRLATHPGDIWRLKKFLAPLPEARVRLLAFVREVLRAWREDR